MSNTATKKKPYELKAERNREILNTFFNYNPEHRTLIAALLSYAADSEEKDAGYIDVAIGKKTKNGFNIMLNSFTDKPIVRLGNWNNTEPTMCIGRSDRRINNILCSLNLSLIDNLETKIQSTDNYDRYTFTFRYDGAIDYQITVFCTVFTNAYILRHIAE